MVYEYECQICKRVLEVSHSITDPVKWLLYCPGCGRMRSVKRLISKSSFILSSKTPWAKEGYSREGQKVPSKRRKF